MGMLLLILLVALLLSNTSDDWVQQFREHFDLRSAPLFDCFFTHEGK
jgi:hypothetical protein